MTLYLTLGALVALAGLVLLYIQSGAKTFDLVALSQQLEAQPLRPESQSLIFWSLAGRVWHSGFALALSQLGPHRIWSRSHGDGHAPRRCAQEIRDLRPHPCSRTLLPQGLRPGPPLGWLCLGNILYCGWVAMRQKDLNQLIGHSSVAHMGFVFLGIASMSLIGLSGAILVMIAHGFLAALCFALSGYLWDQKKTLEMEQYGGLLRQTPFVGALLVMAMMAGCGLPGFANFAGEVTVLFGAWDSLSGVVVGTAWGAR